MPLSKSELQVSRITDEGGRRKALEVMRSTYRDEKHWISSDDKLVSLKELQDDSVATAVVYDADGKASYANVTPALLSETRSILGSIKECPPEDTTSVALLNSPGTLQQLVDVRTERMQLIRLRISKLLDRNFLAKLKKFEQVLGLSRADELSANLPASELIDRLSRIDHAIKKFQNSKGSVKR